MEAIKTQHMAQLIKRLWAQGGGEQPSPFSQLPATSPPQYIFFLPPYSILEDLCGKA